MSHRPQQSSVGNSGSNRIFSGSVLPTTIPHPPPPSSPPPKPTHICKIAVLGDTACGKSSLIHKFIHRKYATTSQCCIIVDGNHGKKKVCYSDEVKYGNNGTTQSAAASYNSLGTTSFGTTIGGHEEAGVALADYYKKDVTIWDYHNKNNGNANQDEEVKSVCIRVQCWDINIELPKQQQQQQQQPQTTGLDDQSITSESSFLRRRQHSASSNIVPLLTLFKKMNGIIISCRCPLRPCYTSVSSNVSLASIISNASGSDWPELDLVEEQIRIWSSYIHDIMKVNNDDKQHQQQKRTIFVILTCADLAIPNYSPREWMTLSIRMQDICNTCNINSWKMGTCINTSTLLNIPGTTTFHLNKNQHQQSSSSSLILQRMVQQQYRLLQDMEDGIEDAFIDLISMHIDQTR